MTAEQINQSANRKIVLALYMMAIATVLLICH